MPELEQILSQQTVSQLCTLFKEAESFRKTNALSENSKIGQISQQVFTNKHPRRLTLVCNEVYRQLALDAIAQYTRR